MKKKNILIIILSLFSITIFSQKIKFTPIDDKSLDFKVAVIGSAEERQYAEYIDYKAANLETIHEIRFKILVQKGNSQFYFNVFKNNNGKPGEILHHILIKSKAKYKTQSISINLTDLEFVFPKDGIFIGFEWIIQRKNEQIPDKLLIQNSSPSYYPKLQLKTSEKNNIWSLKNNIWEKSTSCFGNYNSFDLEIN